MDGAPLIDHIEKLMKEAQVDDRRYRDVPGDVDPDGFPGDRPEAAL
jgi:hypothetical protein